jgi:hypothetical protein
MDRQMDGWNFRDEWTDRWTDAHTDGWKGREIEKQK